MALVMKGRRGRRCSGERAVNVIGMERLSKEWRFGPF